MKKTLLSFVAFLLCVLYAYAVNTGDKDFMNAGGPAAPDETKAFSQWAAGLRVSTLGVGIEASTNINNYFKLRGGLNFISLSPDITIGIDDSNLRQVIKGNYDPDYKMDAGINMFNGNILVDIYPTGSGIFHLTAGFYLGQNKIKAKGKLVNPDTGEKAELDYGLEWPTLNLEGHEIRIENGEINGNIYVGKVIKPYLGIGLGNSIAKTKNRLSFMFELGVMYQGDYTIKQGGKKVNIDNIHDESFDDIKKYTDWFKWWPILNFQLSYRFY